MGAEGKSAHLWAALQRALPPPSPNAGRVKAPASPWSDGLTNVSPLSPGPATPGPTSWLLPVVAQAAASAITVMAHASARRQA